MENDIVRLVRISFQMRPWQTWEKSKEEELLIQIELVTDKKTSETIRDILTPEKNSYTFDTYLRKLDTTLYAISMGIPIDEILKAIDNRIECNKSIYTLIEEYSEKPLDLHLDKLADFDKAVKHSGAWKFAKAMKHPGAWKNNNRLLSEKKNGGGIRIRTRQQGGTLKYKRYELRVYNRSPPAK